MSLSRSCRAIVLLFKQATRIVGRRDFNTKNTNLSTTDFKQKDSAHEAAFFTRQDREALVLLGKKLERFGTDSYLSKVIAEFEPENNTNNATAQIDPPKDISAKSEEEDMVTLKSLFTTHGSEVPSAALLDALMSWKETSGSSVD